MSQLWPLGLLWACGILISIQATINVAFGRTLGVWLFAFIFTVVQLAATLAAFLVFGKMSRLADLASAPPWQFIGGALGLPLLVGMAYGLGRTGTLAGFIALVAGQMIMGLIIDNYGLFAAPQFPVTWARVGGVGLVLLGLALARV